MAVSYSVRYQQSLINIPYEMEPRLLQAAFCVRQWAIPYSRSDYTMPLQSQIPDPVGSILMEINQPGLFGAPSLITSTFTSSGSWIAPADVTSAKVECWGGGHGGSVSTAGNGGAGGGGGEYAAESALAVTQGNTYSYTVGTGGSSGAAGTNTSLPGDSVTVIAHGASAG